MRRKKANNLNRNNKSNGTSEASRMLDALEKKNILIATIHLHRSYQKQASFYLKTGDKEKAQQFMTLLEEDQRKYATVPISVNVSPFSDNDSAGSGGDKTNDSCLSSITYDKDNNDDDDNDDNDDDNDDDPVVVLGDHNNDDDHVEIVVVTDSDGDDDGEDDDDNDDDTATENESDSDSDDDNEDNHDHSNNHEDYDISVPNLSLVDNTLEKLI